MTFADFDLPGPLMIDPGDVARFIGHRDASPDNLALGSSPEIALEILPPGLAPCPTCSTEQAPRDRHMAVHFATREATRPCAGSWPAKVRR